MSRKLKVYGTNLGGQWRGIVAATSQKEAARLLRTSTYDFRQFGGETGDAEECAMALAEPGVAFRKAFRLGSEWERLTPNK